MRSARCSALRKGRDMSKPPIGLGSHLDTQPTGGKFDGVLGTLAALEVVRTLNDAGIETDAPICIVQLDQRGRLALRAGDDGARPPMSAISPPTIFCRARMSTASASARRSTASAIAARAPVGTQKFASFVELHIEQGPILEAENKTIGVVDSGQGVLWYDGKITGFESHAGSTPMPLRRDALATLSEIVLAMERIAREHGPNAVGTIGEAVIANPSRNVIPGEIAFTIDCAAPMPTTMDALDKDLRAAIAEIAARRKASRSRSIWSGTSRRRISIRSSSTPSRTRDQVARLFASPHHLRRRP